MARVLFCWEIGAAFGHLHTLIPIARVLADAGHEVVLAARDVIEPWNIIKDLNARIVVAPRPSVDPRFSDPTLRKGNFTGLLATLGYTRVEYLAPCVRAWDGLLELIAPQLVVCDYAPTAVLAAHDRVPVVVAGNGFSVPPPTGSDFPPFDPEIRSEIDTAEVLGVMREVQRRRGRSEPATVTEPFARATTFVTTYPELDPYGRGFAEGVVGPLAAPHTPPIAPQRNAYFAYLTCEQAGVVDTLRRLTAAGVSGVAYLRQRPAGVAEQFAGSCLTILDAPADVHQVIPEVRAVLHHGGAGLAEAALTHGRPQVILPLQGEQLMTGKRLRDLGVCSPVTAPTKPADLCELVRRAMREPALGQRSREVAEKLFAQGPWNGLARIVDHCRTVLG